ncbi:plasmid mobilization protein [Brackiella oedipodis]|uniref:plasmid mobilization protein n=1 Tax=Brackiella oedipodis TaxID=124225 RepID=UPI00048CD5B6|nr:plasmid mobilization relaxosome protein MobC [Brackiella oedipodis]
MKVYGLSAQTKEKLKKLALEKTGKTSLSNFTKQLLIAQIAPEHEKTPITAPKRQTARVEVRISQELLKKLTQDAQQSDMTVNQFITFVLTRYAASNTILTRKEVATLRESNYQLFKIGHNLNQIAKALNQGQSSSLTTTQIKTLNQHIDQHLNEVHTLIDQNYDRL